MNHKKVLRILVFAMLVAVLAAGIAMADDGAMFRRNVSKTPDQATERANLNHMSFYVPAQSSNGTIGVPIEYYDINGALVETRDYAKPLVAVYIDHLPEVEEGTLESELLNAGIYSGMTIGAHDAHAAVSLDDGATWKRTNLSNSADLSSFTGMAPGINQGIPYPGDAHNMTFAIAGDKVLVGWISKYCDGGSPLYTFTDDAIDALQIAFGLPDLYVRDIWGVNGSQGSVDYTVQGFPEVGEIPYSCVWSARGQLLLDDETGTYDIVWTKAERLTSGRRDANRLEMNADGAAGFMMTWQEDPEGLRPGQGLGPGEGWSGAVVNQQTDLWYSFISIEDFVMVQTSDTDTTPIDIVEYIGDTVPKVAVPMAMPIRLTDNAMCQVKNTTLPYCFVDFETDPVDDVINPYLNTDLPDDLSTLFQSTSSTFCTTTESWTPPGSTIPLNLCVAEDGRVLGGRVGASRPRVNVQPYNSLFVLDDTDDTTWYDSAIVIMGAEESKALGEGASTLLLDPLDVGKNMWYYSFDLRNPNFVLQGGMLNQPAINPETDTFFDLLEDDFGNFFYETEIARRFSHFSQPIHQFGPSGISAALIVKQGIINQGGPADIFLRLTEADTDLLFACDLNNDGLIEEQCLPEGYNPYAYENLVCENLDSTSGWEYLPLDDTRDGVIEPNPRYVQGLCTSNMINVSGTSIVACDGTVGDCADQFPWEGVEEGANFPKVTEWTQSGPNYGEDLTIDNIGTLHDQSWVNPYDVAKGHRGFIDGDFIMMMYAWSPNWQANSVGNDHYNLYARRSFDGGKTWTTLPAEFPSTITLPEDLVVTADGTETCENYKNGTIINTVCLNYPEGDFEPARNLSQLIGNKVTILDPRYTPTGGLKMLPITDLKLEFPAPFYPDDERDPSKFFIVYETGDNTTVAEGEAVPMDLFYSRATNFGDDYFLVEYANQNTAEVTLGFDWLEHDRYDLSGEAANTANNGGTYYYVIWNQWQEDEHENVSESDAIFRRVYFGEVEAVPTAKILYVSQTLVGLEETPEDAVLLIVATARDMDYIDGLPQDDIGAVEWTLDGVDITDLADEHDPKRLYYQINCENCTFPGLHPGWHNFSFKASDKGGRWSPGVSVDIYVTEGSLYRNYLPMYIPEPNIIE